MSPSPERSPPDPRARRLRHALVVTPLLVGNAVMLALCLLGFQVLSATRAYVGGESLWSKSRALAIDELRRFASSGDPVHLQAFDKALATPLGDRDARLEMEKADPDPDKLLHAFEQGGLSQEDIPGMVRLYRWFGQTELMSASIEAWERADDHILMLQALGVQLKDLWENPASDPAVQARRMATALRKLDAEEAPMLALERRFSAALGEASRSTFRVLSWLTSLSTLTLTLTTFLLVRHGLLRQARYEAALEVANRRWALAAESDGLGVFEWFHHNGLVSLDARACAAYGLASDAAGLVVPVDTLRALVEPEDEAARQAQLEALALNGALFHHRYRVFASNRYIEITSMMHGTQAGGDRRMVGIIRDVSDRVRQEAAELDRAAAERTAAARMEFLSRLSHELRTPLNAVLGFSELLMIDQAEPLSERQQQRIQLIADAGAHLLHLVDDVLDISSIDSGKLRMAREATPLAPVLAAAAALVSTEQQEFGIRLDIATVPPELAVWGDSRRLGQVLSNLLSNACKYNRPGGRVQVAVQQGDEGRLLRIEVSDEGEGLAPEQIAQLFQPFKRLPAALARRGSGLGLTIVKLLVEQMGGSVSVRSKPGNGSVFSVSLQRAPSA